MMIFIELINLKCLIIYVPIIADSCIFQQNVARPRLSVRMHVTSTFCRFAIYIEDIEDLISPAP